MNPFERELERQRALLGALWRDDAAVSEWLRLSVQEGRVPALRGLQAYRANAGAVAERALAASFPVVLALVGVQAFAGLARAFWQASPPRHGDLATIVDGLPAFIARDPRLADVPYLADVARLEAALACAESAADAPGTATGRLQALGVLARHEARELYVDLAPGAAVVRSAWPIATLWRAHRPRPDEAAMAAAREAIAARRGEIVFVWRPEWAACLDVVDEPAARLLEAAIAGRSLADAHACAQAAEPGWSFEGWLLRAVQAQWHAGARVSPAGATAAG